RAVDRPLPDADRFGRNHDALRIDPVEQAVESAPDFTNYVGIGDDEVADEHFVRVDRVAAELGNLADLAAAAVEVGKEQRHAVERLHALLARRGARQQQDLLGLLRLGVPDLLAVYDP